MLIIDVVILSILMISIFCSVKTVKVDFSKDIKLISRNSSVILKGISAFFVFASHTHKWMRSDFTINGFGKITDAFLMQLGGMGVLLFFFLSGYGIQEGYGNKSVDKEYIIKRAKNVLFPYYFMKSIFLIIELCAGIVSLDRMPERIIRVLALEDWFIRVIVIEYAVYYIVRKISREKYILLLFLIDVVLAGIFIIQGRSHNYNNSMWLFIFGILISVYQKRIIKVLGEHCTCSLLISFIIFITMGIVFATNKGKLWADIFKPISGMALCVFFLLIVLKFDLRSFFLHWGGRRSLYLYIVHMWVFRMSRIFIENLAIMLVVYFLSTIVIVEVCYKIWERIAGHNSRHRFV